MTVKIIQRFTAHFEIISLTWHHFHASIFLMAKYDNLLCVTAMFNMKYKKCYFEIKKKHIEIVWKNLWSDIKCYYNY